MQQRGQYWWPRYFIDTYRHNYKVPEQLQPKLQHPPPVRGCEGRAAVVDNPLHELEWVEPHRQEAKRHPRDRCLLNGMGQSVPRHQDRRSLVQEREGAPHQLPGTPGCIPGLQVLLQRQEKHPCPTKNGQLLSRCIHQENGRDSVPSPEQAEQGVLVMVYGEGHLCTSTTSCMEAELHSRRGIQSNEGQVRLDALPVCLPPDQQDSGTTGGGLICVEAVCPTSLVCELETRPGGSGHGCLHSQ